MLIHMKIPRDKKGIMMDVFCLRCNGPLPGDASAAVQWGSRRHPNLQEGVSKQDPLCRF